MNQKEAKLRINNWYDSLNVNKASGLKFEIPLDNFSSIDLRFIKNFIQRGLQCLAYNKKWEKLCSVGLKFNALTRYILEIICF